LAEDDQAEPIIFFTASEYWKTWLSERHAIKNWKAISAGIRSRIEGGRHGGATLAGVSSASERRRQNRDEILNCPALFAVHARRNIPDSGTQANSRRATQRTARNLPP